MAAPGGKYFIQDKMQTPAVHHEHIKMLWEKKWKAPCSMGVYPFMFGSIKDFGPVMEELITLDMKEPYDWDAYAQPFLAKANMLVEGAIAAEEESDFDKASELYLRTSALYRIARFPYPRSELQKYAWETGKEFCLKGLSLRNPPTAEVQVPHEHGLPHEGKHIPVYYTLPIDASPTHRAPLVVILTGLDGYRTELAVWAEGWAKLHCATVILEIPGTGDSPADASDPTSPDRQISSLLDWVVGQPALAQDKIVCWGFSTGGYYSIRLAHTHAARFAGVVSQGGGCHHMFDAEWLDAAQQLEYPFDLSTSLCRKFGYGADFESFKKEGRDKFSLLSDGTLDKPCTRLLLVNGTEDEIFPIDDYYLLLQHGDPKEARFVKDTKHMGEPLAFVVILKWLYKVLGVDADPSMQLRGLPFKAKY